MDSHAPVSGSTQAVRTGQQVVPQTRKLGQHPSPRQVWVLVQQVAPQARPFGQHAPRTHVSPVAQRVPHAPHAVSSVCRSRHTPEQQVRPGAQEHARPQRVPSQTHCPFRQTLPSQHEHRVPQLTLLQVQYPALKLEQTAPSEQGQADPQ